METNIAPRVMNIAGQPPQPAPAKARPHQGPQHRQRQADHNQHFSKIVHLFDGTNLFKALFDEPRVLDARQFRVKPVLFDQFLVGAALRDFPMPQH